MNDIGMAFFLTTMAGLSTLVGAIPIFFNLDEENNIISFSLSFAASVMLWISILDLLPESFKLLFIYKDVLKIMIVFISLILGIITSCFVNSRITSNNSLYKVGIVSMFAVVIHNIPEGIITFISATSNLKLGLSLAMVIALHNIPEGISISIPIYYATGSKIKALLYTFISGIAELLGAIFTYLFLFSFINNVVLGILLSVTAGIMINISLTELLPESFKYNNTRLTIFSFIVGIVIVIVNLMF